MRSASWMPAGPGATRSSQEPVAARPGRPRRRGERAQGLVEFAMVLPMFLVLFLATIDFGWGLRQYIVMTNSAREGARIGAVGETEANITNKVVSTSSGILTAADITVTGEEGASGTAVTVSVTKNYSYITPLGGIFSTLTGGTLPSPLPMSTSATMRLE